MSSLAAIPFFGYVAASGQAAKYGRTAAKIASESGSLADEVAALRRIGANNRTSKEFHERINQRASETVAPTRNVPASLLDDIVGEANLVASPGGAISDAQRTILRQNLPVIQRRSAFQNQIVRKEFVRDQARHIADWERMTGRTWPSGATPHHVIPLESGGANAWWNLMPTNGRLPNHSLPGIPGPHAAGGVLRESIQQGRRALPSGTTTDLRITQ